MLINFDAISIEELSGGTLQIWSSNLERERCPHCDTPNCNYSCDLSVAVFEDGSTDPLESEEEVLERLKYNHALDVIESMVLAFTAASKGVIDTIALKDIVNRTVPIVLDSIGNCE